MRQTDIIKNILYFVVETFQDKFEIPIDVALILDASNWAAPFYNAQKVLTNVITDGISVSENSKYSIASYSSTVRKIRSFDDKINDVEISFDGKGVRFDLAINHAIQVFSPKTERMKIAIFVTSGILAPEKDKILNQARKLKSLGVVVMVIAIGDQFDFDIIRSLASSERLIFLTASPSQLTKSSFLKEIIRRTFEVAG